jgi:hypothetical protein
MQFNKEFIKKFLSNIKIETTLNKEDGQLPFGYFCPQLEGKLIWMCGEDEDGKITSVFNHKDDDDPGRLITYVKDFKEACFARDELIKSGWQKMKLPTITFTYPGMDEKIVIKS